MRLVYKRGPPDVLHVSFHNPQAPLQQDRLFLDVPALRQPQPVFQLTSEVLNMQLATLLPLALAAISLKVNAAPVAQGIDVAEASLDKRQSWQDSVDQALADANAAITNGISTADAAVGDASWQDAVDQALAEANAAIQNGLNSAGAAIGKRQ